MSERRSTIPRESKRANAPRAIETRHSHAPVASAPRRTPAPLNTAELLPTLLTAGEVAGLLRTSRKAVYAMAERSQLPGVTRVGRRLLVQRDDLLSWLNERRAASPGGTWR
ncbi:MAG: helix-turn-helix domain-containing protein [Polyangiaceae bacterium]